MTEYRLLTIWRIAAPLQQVFDAVFDSLHWPDWWPGADSVEQLHPGDADGVGSIRRYVWKGALPYRLAFNACATRIDVPHKLEATVNGDLAGSGTWTFSHEAGITTVRYEWRVHTTKHWMNALSPLAGDLFADNHHALMQKGGEGLARLLNARLVDAAYADLPDARKRGVQPRPNWAAAALAGAVAGFLATLIQMALWWIASYSPVEMLLRDARLAAAIVVGRSVLPPPASFDWTVMLIATLLHFALSVVYGLVQAPIILRIGRRASVATGASFGLLLFVVNMYGFTALFPWFEASRDWITAAAHIAFGMTAAITYKAIRHLESTGELKRVLK
jgi:uncharacterized protein YndB with AHSA1/START domain